MSVITALIIPVLSACFAHYIAILKNRNAKLWAVFAFFFNIIALLILACLPVKKDG